MLKRELGLWSAVFMGLGSIVGTGVFVSIAIAANLAGKGIILAVAIAALVAICNGLNSAQLAADHPVSGGTYEYGYKYLNPWLGFSAGWLFLLAKTASAATAALGFSGYFLTFFNLSEFWLIPLALFTVFSVTCLVLKGIRKSNLVNTIIVSITLSSLILFIIFGCLNNTGLISGQWSLPENLISWDASLWQAIALMFVAYTGYGRIATMGEEVKSPRQTIPQAIVLCLGIATVLYLLVAIVYLNTNLTELCQKIACSPLTLKTAPLELIAQTFRLPIIAKILAIGAMTAMLGVLLNLILGLSRVWLAMGRRRDLPLVLATLDRQQTTPYIAVITTGIAIALLVLLGNVKTTWSFSAFNVLIYYSITNLAALRLPKTARLYPQWLAIIGLIACAFLAFWVESQIWLVGLGLIGLGLIIRLIQKSRSSH